MGVEPIRVTFTAPGKGTVAEVVVDPPEGGEADMVAVLEVNGIPVVGLDFNSVSRDGTPRPPFVSIGSWFDCSALGGDDAEWFRLRAVEVPAPEDDVLRGVPGEGFDVALGLH